MKNTCIWMTSDDSPAGIPSLIPRKSSPNWQTPIAKPYNTTSRHGIAGRRMKNTIGTAARKKRSAASVNGGTSVERDLDRDERVAPDRNDGERQREIARGEVGFHEGSECRACNPDSTVAASRTAVLASMSDNEIGSPRNEALANTGRKMHERFQ